jgi:broad specificity phosphatase PhoE
MEIIFVRHGETQHNKEHRIMGQRIDDTLDQDGLHQAAEILAKLPQNCTIIFSSPLKRALQTADIISRHFNIPVKINNWLKERDFGTLSGKTWEQINALAGEDLKQRDENLEYDYKKFGGESVAQVKLRLTRFLDELKARYPHEKPIVVTHYGLIMLMDALYPPKIHESLGNVSMHKYKV